MNEIEIINASLEKSNLILKKYKLLIKNNYTLLDKKTTDVATELVNHLKSTYSYSNLDIISLMNSYEVEEELISSLGGIEIASFIANSVKNLLKED